MAAKITLTAILVISLIWIFARTGVINPKTENGELFWGGVILVDILVIFLGSLGWIWGLL